MTAYEENMHSSRKRLNSDDLETTVWTWFKAARSKLIPVSGPMIQEEARRVAERLSLTHVLYPT